MGTDSIFQGEIEKPERGPQDGLRRESESGIERIGKACFIRGGEKPRKGSGERSGNGIANERGGE